MKIHGAAMEKIKFRSAFAALAANEANESQSPNAKRSRQRPCSCSRERTPYVKYKVVVEDFKQKLQHIQINPKGEAEDAAVNL